MGNFNKSVDTYQYTFELLVNMSKSIVSFARVYKYTFGERIINYTLDATTEVYLAKDEYNQKDKILHINNALKSLALLGVIWKACGEIPNLSTNIYVEQMENISTINKQLRSRRDFCEKALNKEK